MFIIIFIFKKRCGIRVYFCIKNVLSFIFGGQRVGLCGENRGPNAFKSIIAS